MFSFTCTKSSALHILDDLEKYCTLLSSNALIKEKDNKRCKGKSKEILCFKITLTKADKFS